MVVYGKLLSDKCNPDARSGSEAVPDRVPKKWSAVRAVPPTAPSCIGSEAAFACDAPFSMTMGRLGAEISAL